MSEIITNLCCATMQKKKGNGLIPKAISFLLKKKKKHLNLGIFVVQSGDLHFAERLCFFLFFIFYTIENRIV